MLFVLKDSKLKEVKKTDFKNEKALQTFVEDNMQDLLGLRFLATEFVIDDHNRVDSVGFDEESNSFVLIEDKNVKDRGLVDQGFAYLAALFDRKEKFVLLYNKVYNQSKQASDFDWSQTRIAFIGPEFDNHQLDSTSFQDLPFDLYQLRKYGDIYSFEIIRNKKKSLNYKNKTKTSVPATKNVLDNIETYTEETSFPLDHPMREVYDSSRDRICDLEDVVIVPLKQGVSFKVNGKRFAYVEPQKTAIRLLINNPPSGLDDPFKMCYDISHRGWGRLSWEMKVNDKTDLDKVMLLVKQSYREFAD